MDPTAALPLLLAQADEAPDLLGGGFVPMAQRGAVAMLLGLLVGAERQYSHSEKEQLFAGVRTFPLISLLGFIAGILSLATGSPGVFTGITAGFCALIVASYVLTSLGEDKGATTEIAGLTVYFLGALCAYGNDALVTFASAAAVASTVLLSMREAIHGVVGKFEKDDIFATLKLAIVTLIVLPLLPARDYGPFDAFNPYKIWKYVVLIAAISFAGYVAVKVLGSRRGIGITGLFGGLASSTAVALAFSRKSRETPALSRAFASAIVLASTIMFPRVLVVVVAVCPPLLDRLWGPVALLTATGVAASAYLHFRAGRTGEEGHGGAVTFRNPFELGSAVKFGMLLAVISFASRAAYETFKEGAYYLVSVLGGMADADGFASQAASLGAGKVDDALRAAAQAAERAGGPPPVAAEVAGGVAFLSTAATAVMLAMIANTTVKGGLTVALGSRELRRYTVPCFALMAVVGVAAAFLLS